MNMRKYKTGLGLDRMYKRAIIAIQIAGCESS